MRRFGDVLRGQGKTILLVGGVVGVAAGAYAILQKLGWI